MTLPKNTLPNPDLIFTPFELSKIRWKSQVYTHIFFGIWMSILAALSWDVGLSAVLKVGVVYIILYLFVYIPLFAVLPYRTLKPTLADTHRFARGDVLTTPEIEKLVIFLLNLPKRAVVETIVVTMSAFTLGSTFWLLGLIPELQNVMYIAVFQTIVLGFIISIVEALYNYVFIQAKVYESVAYLISLYPDLARKALASNHTSLQTKLLLALRGLSMSGQISFLLFLATYLTATAPDQTTLIHAILFMGFVMLFTIMNLLLLTPKIADTFAQPLKILKEWSIKVAQGEYNTPVTVRTTDEIADVIVQSNIMVHELASKRANLEGERNKLTAVISGIVDGIIAINTQNKIAFANEQIHRIFAVPNGSLADSDPGNHIAIFDSSNNEITYRIFSKTDTQIQHTDLRLVDATGTSKFVNITCTPMGNDSNETAYVVAIHDVTKEQELEQMKVDFVSMAAHELRTPLTAITGYLATLQEEMNYFNEDHKLFVNRGLESAQMLMDLVDDLLAISRIERGVLKLDLNSTDWEKLMGETVKDSSALAERKSMTVTITKPTTPLPKIDVDNSRIKEVLHNLISNSIKYSPAKTTITLSAEIDGDNLVTHVSDQGMGIPKSALPRLFSKFYRVGQTSGLNAHSGTGLGLYITKAILDMHHGEIWVTSEENKGSTFSFSLPLTQSGDTTREE